MSINSVPWGEVKTFSQFLKTKTAKKFLMDAELKNKKIKVPECAIKIISVKGKKKKTIPLVGENNNQVLKKLGYSLSNLEVFKKNKIL